MKKKVVSIMMTAALEVGMLAGCGNSDSGSSNCLLYTSPSPRDA